MREWQPPAHSAFPAYLAENASSTLPVFPPMIP
jgi:hypothetical protein